MRLPVAAMVVVIVSAKKLLLREERTNRVFQPGTIRLAHVRLPKYDLGRSSCGGWFVGGTYFGRSSLNGYFPRLPYSSMPITWSMHGVSHLSASRACNFIEIFVTTRCQAKFKIQLRNSTIACHMPPPRIMYLGFG